MASALLTKQKSAVSIQSTERKSRVPDVRRQVVQEFTRGSGRLSGKSRLKPKQANLATFGPFAAVPAPIFANKYHFAAFFEIHKNLAEF